MVPMYPGAPEALWKTTSWPRCVMAIWVSADPKPPATTALPPPHAPTLHVSPVVHTLPSSHEAPGSDGMHTDGFPEQVKHGSTWHSALQPSPSRPLPSKQVQRVPTT